jgi:hypothetical protein
MQGLSQLVPSVASVFCDEANAIVFDPGDVGTNFGKLHRLRGMKLDPAHEILGSAILVDMRKLWLAT